MRDYATLSPSFWTGETGRKLHGDPVAQVVASYLVTSRHSNQIGLYYLPIAYITHDTGLSQEAVSAALAKLSSPDIEFCMYDEQAEYVWVRTAARRQTTRSPKAISGARRELEKSPAGKLRSAFEQFYGSDLSRLHTVSIPYPTKENTVPVGDPPVLPRSGSGSGTRSGAGTERAHAEQSDRFEQTRATVRREFAQRFERAEHSMWTRATDPAVDTFASWLLSVPGDLDANLTKTLDTFFADSWVKSEHFPVQHLAKYPQRYHEPRERPQTTEPLPTPQALREKAREALSRGAIEEVTRLTRKAKELEAEQEVRRARR